MNKCGIFMSQCSGIITKQNFQIDICDSFVILYIHHLNLNEDLIKLGIQIIQSIYAKIKNNANKSNEMFTISNDTMSEINNEYTLFCSHKEELQKLTKDIQGKMIYLLDKLKLSTLNNYLSTKFMNEPKNGIHKCNICNLYTSNTLKGMAAHKRGCKKKDHSHPQPS